MTIRDVNLKDALGDRYLSYALSTIVSRSLPDVRDGLKPVHRRLLHAMRELKLNQASGFKKCARVVGDVIGKYHPHGEQAVYDAMVRLAQDFAMRYPVVDGQGNFGNVDGDSAAAARYTEARLTLYAEAMTQGIDEDAVDFRPTYDGEHDEPAVMPAAVPNLLANGATGIAVGMATSIPPHNLGELCTGLIRLVKNPDMTVRSLVKAIPGPDFPTGGILLQDPESIVNTYESGRGSFRLRARWEVEKLPQGQYQIVVTEIPYTVQKSKLIEKIADLLLAKKLPLLGNLRDESAEDIRVIIEPKSRGVDPEVLMQSLFRHTDLDTRISVNMNVLDAHGIPRVMNLKEVLQAFIDHRRVVLLRRTQYRLNKIDHRLEVLGGYLIAHLNIDEVIKIIREEDKPAPIMMQRWNLTEVQVEAILNMRLRSLRKLEEIQIKTEHDNLTQERIGLVEVLESSEVQNAKLIEQLEEAKKTFGPKTEVGKRRTSLEDEPDEVIVPIEAIIEREPVTVVSSQKGWIRSMKGHNVKQEDIKYKEGDEESFILKVLTTDKILVLTTIGKCYTVAVDKLPGGRGHGDPLRLMLDLHKDEEIVTLMTFQPQQGEAVNYLLASSDGRGFIVPSAQMIAQTKNGKQLMNVSDKAKLSLCVPVKGDSVAIVGQNRKLLIIQADEIPTMNRGRGVSLQRYKDGGISDAKFFNKQDGLTWKIGDRTRTETNLITWLGKRGQAGRLPPVGFPRTNKFE